MESLGRAAIDFGPVILAGIVPFIRVLRGGSVIKESILFWALLVLFCFLVSVHLPMVVSWMYPEIQDQIYELVPDTTIVGVSVMAGWFWALLLLLPARGIRAAVGTLKPKDSTMPPREEA